MGELCSAICADGVRSRTVVAETVQAAVFIPGRVDISERPGEVEEKSRVGDWEVDTIIGSRHLGALVSLVDRASKFMFLSKVRAKTAQEVGEAVLECLGTVKELVHTIDGG